MARKKNTVDSDLDALFGGADTTPSRRRRVPATGIAGNPSGPTMQGGPSGPAMSGGPSGPAMQGGEAPKRRRKSLKDNDTLRQLLG